MHDPEAQYLTQVGKARLQLPPGRKKGSSPGRNVIDSNELTLTISRGLCKQVLATAVPAAEGGAETR